MEQDITIKSPIMQLALRKKINTIFFLPKLLHTFNLSLLKFKQQIDCIILGVSFCDKLGHTK